MNLTRYALLIFSILFFFGCQSEQKDAQVSMNQFPSPMIDNIRAHERIEQGKVPGESFILTGLFFKPVEVYIADKQIKKDHLDLHIHFHGLSYVPKYAAYHSNHPLILAVINLGSGSSVYEKPFLEEPVFPGLIKAILDSVSARKSMKVKPSRIILSSFSAGYGAVRAILRNHQSIIDGVVLLDGLHTDYIPSGRVLSEGGTLNNEKLSGFVGFARLAMENKKRFLITHSEIFPGTYASTTETTDYLIETLNLKRQPVLKWGPVGMQMLSETHLNGLTILGFAGNTAPDHVDHYHSLPVFIAMLLKK